MHQERTDEADGPSPRLLLTTCPPAAAAKLAETLVAERLVACVIIMPAGTSVYRWQGEVTRDEECVLMMKTAADRIGALADRIRDIHPFELPEVIAVPVIDGLAPYIEWVIAETRPLRP